MQAEMKYMGLEEETSDDLSKITDESTLHEGKKFWSKISLLIKMLVLFVWSFTWSKWNLYIKNTILGLKMMVKSGLESLLPLWNATWPKLVWTKMKKKDQNYLRMKAYNPGDHYK